MEIPLSAVTMHPKGTPAPASAVEAQVSEERVDLSNDMTWRQMVAVGVRRVVLARGELDKLKGPKYAEEGRVAPKGGRSRESKGSAGGGVAGPSHEGRGRGERRDRG